MFKQKKMKRYALENIKIPITINENGLLFDMMLFVLHILYYKCHLAITRGLFVGCFLASLKDCNRAGRLWFFPMTPLWGNLI